MSLELSSTKAQGLYLGHLWGLISRQSIVEIAEAIITASQNIPSSELCELAVCQMDSDVKERLRPFSKQADKWQSIQELINYLDVPNLVTSNRYKLYYGISNYIDWDDPKQWVKIKVLCHELSDARAGVYGDEKAISKEIYETLINAIA